MKVARYVAAAGAVAAAATLGVSTPAMAMEAPDRECRTDWFCVYKDWDYSQANSMYRINYENFNWQWELPAVYRADSSWLNYNKHSWAVCDEGIITITTIALDNGEGIKRSTAANNRGESNVLDYCD